MQRLPSAHRSGLVPAARQSSARFLLSTACLAGLVGLVLGGAGCDQVKESSVQQADRRVAENIGKGETAAGTASDKAAKARITAGAAPAEKASADKPVEDSAIIDLAESLKRSNDTVTSLTAAANEAGASNEARATAKAKLARVEYAMAVRLSPEVERKQRMMDQAMFDLRQIAQRIAESVQTRAGYNLHDPAVAGKPSETNANPVSPKDTLAEREKTITAAYKKAEDDATALQAELSKRNDAIKAMKDEKTKAEQDAEALRTKAADAKGKEGFELFNQTSALRQKAAELGIQIDAATMALLPYERMLAISEKQKVAWDNKTGGEAGAMQRLADSKKKLDEAWAARQQDIAAVTTDLGKMGQEMTDRAGAVPKLASDAKALRDATISRLTAAAKHFGEAADACKQLNLDLGAKIKDEKNAKLAQLGTWKNTLRLYDQAYFRVQQGSAQLTLAELQSQLVRELEARKRGADELTATMKDSGVTLPTTVFPDDAAKELETARADADKAFDTAEKTLDAAAALNGMAGGDLEATHTTAHLLAIESRVAHLAIARDPRLINAALVDDKVWADANKIELPPGVAGKMPVN